MKKLLLFVSLLWVCCLIAQTYQLPLVEVTGEGQLKIPLAPGAALALESSAPPDSLDHFYPSLHSRYSYFPKPKSAALKGRFEAALGSNWNALLRGSVYHIHPVLPHLRLELDHKYLPQGFRNLQHDFYAMIDPNGTEQVSSLLDYQYADAKNYRGNSFMWKFVHQADSLRDKDWTLRKMYSSVWWETSSQKLNTLHHSHHTPGFWHSHQLSFDTHQLHNQFGSSMGRFAFASSYRLPYSFEGLQYANAGIMNNMDHLVPMLEARWEKIFSPRMLLSAGNYPLLVPHTRSQLLQEYPWALQRQIGKNQMSPLNFAVQLQRSLPAIFGVQDSHRDNASINQLKLGLHSSFSYAQPVLMALATSNIPALAMQPVWQHQLSSELFVRFPWFNLNQSLSLDLQHLPHQRWIRAPYTSLFNLNTKICYQWDKLEASLSLDQGYNQENHQGKNLAELFDLSLAAHYQLYEHIIIKAELDNLLNSRHFVFDTLPASHRQIRLSARYLWR